ncbi:GntR family transcriptional regulator [Streptomyces sp. NPDC005438]|uniref:GntR family transcriptional regulator n=1 Tax=Streptomyces sp. NPDC005438 TaxID=3156880 RepID=UPI0033BCAC38
MADEGGKRQPKYQSIADDLRGAIEAGDYGPGDRLPGENDLMSRYGVARMTARQAIGVLQNEGLTEARKGAGVYVRDFRPLRRQGISRLSAQQWGSGRSIWSADLGERNLEVDHVEVRENEVPERISPVLDVEPGSAVCVRSRRFVLDGKPVLLSTSYLPATLVAGSPILEEDTGPGGTYARLDDLGHKPVRFREEVRSRMPTQAEVDALRLSPGTPVVLICRTAFEEGGKPVEVNEMVLDSASYILEYAFDA